MKRIPLAAGSKKPLGGEDWHNRMSADPAEHQKWLDQGLNIGLPLKENNRVVLDWDGEEHKGGRDLARAFYKQYSELCTFIVETAAGNIHFHFSGSTKTRKIYENGKEVGDIKGSGYVVWVGSVIKGKVYRIIREGPLQPFPEHLFPIPERSVQAKHIDENDPVRRVLRARAWLKKRDVKEDGNGRGLQTIKTCRALFGMFGLTEEQVWPLMLEYNERCCVPPYTEKQLSHKILDAQKG